MTEVLFYHLLHVPLERVLPELLERCLERGWRAVVQAGNAERVEVINDLLWKYREESFLPHGTREDGPPEAQPVYITDQEENPNKAQVLFLVDGARPGETRAYERCVFLFDGHHEDSVAAARQYWKEMRDAGHVVTYWQQNSSGHWEKKA